MDKDTRIIEKAVQVIKRLRKRFNLDVSYTLTATNEDDIEIGGEIIDHIDELKEIARNNKVALMLIKGGKDE